MSKCKCEIGGIGFKTKKALIGYIQENILHAYPVFKSLSVQHMAFMTELLQKHHPHGNKKIGPGVECMWAQPCAMNNGKTRQFWLRRTDGTETDFSYLRCINRQSKRQDFYEACRRTVADQIISFRNQYFRNNPNAVCPVTGTSLSPNNCHVDHCEPQTFKRLADEFLDKYEIDLKKVKLSSGIDGELSSQFVDQGLADRWAQYHRKHAALRVIGKEANLKRLGDERNYSEPFQR